MENNQLLNDLADIDTVGFLSPVSQWDNHRPMLYLALHLTAGRVIEFGSGCGSTGYLSKFCEDHGREFKSYDGNADWAKRTNSILVQHWDMDEIYEQCGLCFIDHAPGEHRHVAVSKMKDKADIIVIHDSEVGGAGNYMYDRVYPFFKFRLDYNLKGGGAGTTALSNTVNLNQFRGHYLRGYKFDA